MRPWYATHGVFVAAAVLLSCSWSDGASSGADSRGSAFVPSSVETLTEEGDYADYPQGFLRPLAGRLSLFFDRVLADASSFRVHELRFDATTGKWRRPRPISLGDEPMQGASSCVSLPDGEYLYFVKASGLRSEGELFRVKVGPEGLGKIEQTKMTRSIALLSFPKVRALRDGRVALVFRDFESRGILAESDDGLDFSSSSLVVDESLAQLGIADFADGTLAVAYQTDREGGGKTTWIRFLQDGHNHWTPRIQIAPEQLNVHDPYLFPRLDGNLDIYYSATPEHKFLLYRRSVTSAGALGPEEKLTEPGRGSLLMPQIERLDDGRLLVVVTRLLEGQRGHLVALNLVSDAPL